MYFLSLSRQTKSWQVWKYENLINKLYKEPEDGNFEDATKEILEAVSGDSNEEMDPVVAIPVHLADNFNNFNYIHGFFWKVIFVSAYYY